MSQVDIQNISKSFGSLKVLDDINISIRDGEFLTLVGPSGCGKSTLVRIIAGLESQSAGTISVDGASVNHLRPHERKLSMVFQSYALYPHMTAFDNIAVPLTVEKLSLLERIPLIKHLSPRRKRLTQEIAKQVEAVAGQLKIEALLGRKPAQLSGGQRQRVALGRAMVRQPRAFLMDEPLSNLDAKLRVHMRTELTELHKRMGATFIYVTHDQIEAMTMSDRVAMMDGGKVQQLGTPTELYEHPANLEVARFIGSPTINTMPASIGPAGRVEIHGRPLGIAVNLPQGESVTIGIRPEALDLRSPEQAAAGQPIIDARLRRTENLGAEFLHHLDLTGTDATGFIMRTTSPHEDIHEGDAVRLTFDPTLCHIFGPDGRRAGKTHVLLSDDDSGRAQHGSTR
ncbi:MULTISPECIES: ABC transporter ATP-binding protein [Brucella]|uniref:ABC transporter related n=2 Tax=Brucella TaxID=234 RepID=A6WWL4_BRUA4|nr:MULTISPECIES: ABC transporter ATP-binding protein [Brucella]ABS13368.1 ABC transporter related [Brucella anthropi ATCC 49188]KAB2701738.1 ABC transporter ATP-binding protein [Brucella lupini]KAB2734571.1 ABC transporter ATP-binding protein [Brucella anthropi]MDH0366243.1 ABC transporter ATP-binding protein [Brucella anthropi]OYR32611.1 ABC transporter family protein [Brucella lupini]